jgi:hypothetical protein
MEIKEILLTLGFMLLGSLLTFMAAWYWFQKRVNDEKSKEIAAEHIALLTQSILPMNTAFQTILVRELTHFHTPKMDALLEKLGPPYALSTAEEIELSQALEQRTKDMGTEIDQSEREAAIILPYIMRRVRAESDAIRKKNIDKVAFVTFAEPTKIVTGPLVFPTRRKEDEKP